MSDKLSELALMSYRAFGSLIRPATTLLLQYRGAKGKEDMSRLRERYGESSMARSHGPYIWMHAASVGETRTILPLVRRITEMRLNVILTTGTVTSAQIAAVELPRGAVHQYVPLDLKPYVASFLNYWSPSLAIFAESEIWPVKISELSKRGIPFTLVNARMSERSYTRWKKAEGIAHAIFEKANLCLAQTQDDAARFSDLGARPVYNTGNMKFDVPAPSVDPIKLSEFKRAVGDRPCWLAASTHEGEEEIIGKIHAHLKAKVPDLLTIIAPRHPNRGAQIMEQLVGQGHNVVQRSAGALPAADSEIYLADTLSELGIFYTVAPCCLMGGSLLPIGGHNPIEPALLGCTIIYGPNVTNFTQMYDHFDQMGGAVSISDSTQLIDSIIQLLENDVARGQINQAAKLAASSLTGALQRTHDALLPYLTPIAVSDRLAEAVNRQNG